MKQPRHFSFGRVAVLLLLVAAIVAAGLWLFQGSRGSGPSGAPPLAGAPIGGPFTLIDQEGRQVSNDSLKGSYRLVYFGYTFCPDVCPVDVQRMVQGYRLFEAREPAAAKKVQPMFITVDPARDTREVLKSFADSFHPRLLALTGSESAIEEAKRSYRVYGARAAGTDDENYLVDHSAYIYLMDPEGEPIVFFDRGDTPEDIAAGLHNWVS